MDDSNARAGTILPLATDVVAQIRSTSTIVSLEDAVVGLFQNSLDAGASRITVLVTFGRGGCTVEDNGSGILTANFAENGKLGQMHCKCIEIRYFKYSAKFTGSSKRGSCAQQHGRNGTFLSSLAVTSLTTITSQHACDDRLSTIILHNSEVVSRMLPAPRQHGLKYPSHGTRVTVRDLFGNIAVRLKQRSKMQESRSEQEQAWFSLKRRIIELLLPWNSEVFLTLKDVDNGREMKLRPQASRQHSKRFSLQHIQDILVQSSYLSDYNDTWVPLSASTQSISIKGAVSVTPRPSKIVQFISIGILPIRKVGSDSVLYDDINRIFDQSSFGFVEEEEMTSHIEEDRNRIFTTPADVAHRKNRKDLDRWPMFCFNINVRQFETVDLINSEDYISDKQLQLISKVLSKAVIEWLSSRGYVVQVKKKQRYHTADGNLIRSSSGPQPTKKSQRLIGHCGLGQARSSFRKPPKSCISCDERQEGNYSPQQRAGRLSNSAFVEGTILKVASRISAGSIPSASVDNKDIRFFNSNKETLIPSYIEDATCKSPHVEDANATIPVLKDSFAHAFDENLAANGKEDQTGFEHTDKTNNGVLRWVDPLDGSTAFVDPRSGNVLPCRTNTASTRPYSQRLSLRPSTGTSNTSMSSRKDIEWIQDFLRSWKNPVFEPSDLRIPKAIPTDPVHNSQSPEILNLEFRRLSRAALSSSTIVGQVDSKFILVTLNRTRFMSQINLENQRNSKLLVLVDQHAADERCKVETLFSELCEPSSEFEPSLPPCHNHSVQVNCTQLMQAIRFEVSEEEIKLFSAHKDKFLQWGILYETNSQRRRESNDILVMTVRTVPTVIAERCRSDPKLLIDLLRSEIWRIAEGGTKNGLQNNIAIHDYNDHHSWSQILDLCPKGLVELINSRACRSAIMFNDVVSHEDCITLIETLAACSLPFQCAHGRPSMVPLIDLGWKEQSFTRAIDNSTGAFGGRSTANGAYRRGNKQDDFMTAYRRWRSSM